MRPMKSPFPGMDPYIEASGRWRSFHSRLINRIVDMLEAQLPAKYTVLPDAREYIEHDEEFRELFVEIIVRKPEYRLIACIEVLLESNKGRQGSGREMYLRKRQAMLLSDCNFVEIDLLRGGEPMPMR